MKILLIIWVSILFPVNNSHSQSPDCQSIILNHIEKMAALGKPDPKKTYHIDVSIENTTSSNKFIKTEDVNMQIFLTSNQMIYQSPQFNVFQDTEDAFIIMHQQKQIIWSKGKMGDSSNNSQILQMANLQKALVNSSKVTSCTETQHKGEKLQVVEMKMMPGSELKSKIESIKFYYNDQKKDVEQVVIFYNENEPIVKQVITYNKVDWNYKGFKEKPIKSKIFSKDEILIPELKGYTLINNKEA